MYNLKGGIFLPMVDWWFWCYTPLKTEMGIQNDGWEMVIPVKKWPFFGIINFLGL